MIKDTESGKTSQYIVQTLRAPETGAPEFQAFYKTWADRILWIDKNVVPGAFQMNTSWYFAAPEKGKEQVFDEHAHEYDEIIGFFGSDPNDKYSLGAVIQLAIDGEWHELTASSLIFIPKGMKHMPLRILKVDRPIFHFSVVTNPVYDGDTAYKQRLTETEKTDIIAKNQPREVKVTNGQFKQL
ncbi:MAG: hypothetical protein LBD85_06750 [Oscillospiraceae bacterium]|jgi:hypothetical protein|nr:hypothetical protein [Oscillospiraceae bacterium]